MLFGTGLGIACFFLTGMRSDAAAMALFAARTTVVADMIFTLTAGVVLPLTGFWLVFAAGYNPLSRWLVATYVLYLMALACWLPETGSAGTNQHLPALTDNDTFPAKHSW